MSGLPSTTASASPTKQSRGTAASSPARSESPEAAMADDQSCTIRDFVKGNVSAAQDLCFDYQDEDDSSEYDPKSMTSFFKRKPEYQAYADAHPDDGECSVQEVFDAAWTAVRELRPHRDEPLSQLEIDALSNSLLVIPNHVNGDDNGMSEVIAAGWKKWPTGMQDLENAFMNSRAEYEKQLEEEMERAAAGSLAQTAEEASDNQSHLSHQTKKQEEKRPYRSRAGGSQVPPDPEEWARLNEAFSDLRTGQRSVGGDFAPEF